MAALSGWSPGLPGCDVTLFASGDSLTNAALAPACPRALRLGRPRPDPWSAYAALLDAIADRAKSFDVIHCHTDWIHIPLLLRGAVPFVTTMHGRLDLPYLPPRDRKLQACSTDFDFRLALPRACRQTGRKLF
jgi:glycosyltransferase involved in cell wall biosynthesis